MPIESRNPATGELLARIPGTGNAELETILAANATARTDWQHTPLSARTAIIQRAAELLETRKSSLARLMTDEMGKRTAEAIAEIEKCALACQYYAEHGEAFLADEMIASDAGRSFIAWQPLGTVLAVMPWNFPFWQVFRFAAPALLAGNAGLLKHASNVPQCAAAIETLLHDAGVPQDVFRNLYLDSAQVASVIRDPRVNAVTLTGSDKAGRAVAKVAGESLKKTVLELGGSDPFIVLEDADLEDAAKWATRARFQNAGQSCIAAKRFIVVDAIADEFLALFRQRVSELVAGMPEDKNTTLSTMARQDLRDELHRQVADAIAQGATAVIGCAPLREGEFADGAWYQASILAGVTREMRAWHEELFGPVAIVIRVADEAEAIAVANESDFGLGGSVWTADSARGERAARQLQSGAAFVNGMVKSDPRLPFGGVKMSGYGRELSLLGMREFLNAKTVWIR